MNADSQIVVIARILLPAGRERLADRYELREGGPDATRDELLGLLPGASALVPDSSVAVDAGLLDAAGSSSGWSPTSPSATTTSISTRAGNAASW
jgi:hypothetical protein